MALLFFYGSVSVPPGLSPTPSRFLRDSCIPAPSFFMPSLPLLYGFFVMEFSCCLSFPLWAQLSGHLPCFVFFLVQPLCRFPPIPDARPANCSFHLFFPPLCRRGIIDLHPSVFPVCSNNSLDGFPFPAGNTKLVFYASLASVPFTGFQNSPERGPDSFSRTLFFPLRCDKPLLKVPLALVFLVLEGRPTTLVSTFFRLCCCPPFQVKKPVLFLHAF